MRNVSKYLCSLFCLVLVFSFFSFVPTHARNQPEVHTHAHPITLPSATCRFPRERETLLLSQPELTSHPVACCCDLCHSRRTSNGVAGKRIWRSVALWATAAADSRQDRWFPHGSWHCACCCPASAMPSRAASSCSCSFGYRPTCPVLCSWPPDWDGDVLAVVVSSLRYVSRYATRSLARTSLSFICF